MDKLKNRTTGYIVIGIFIAVTMKFILFFVARHTIGTFLLWGYFAKILDWIWLLLMVLYAIKIEKQKFLLWEDEKRSLLFYITSVVSISGLVILSNFIAHGFVQAVSKPEQSLLLKEMLEYLQAHVFLLIFTSITAGVVEELIFRGYLLPRLNILFGNRYLAVIVSSLLFGAFHFKYGTLENIIFPTFVGLIFGFHYQKYRNLRLLAIIHFFIDFLSLVLARQ